MDPEHKFLWFQKISFPGALLGEALPRKLDRPWTPTFQQQKKEELLLQHPFRTAQQVLFQHLVLAAQFYSCNTVSEQHGRYYSSTLC